MQRRPPSKLSITEIFEKKLKAVWKMLQHEFTLIISIRITEPTEKHPLSQNAHAGKKKRVHDTNSLLVKYYVRMYIRAGHTYSSIIFGFAQAPLSTCTTPHPPPPTKTAPYIGNL